MRDWMFLSLLVVLFLFGYYCMRRIDGLLRKNEPCVRKIRHVEESKDEKDKTRKDRGIKIYEQMQEDAAMCDIMMHSKEKVRDNG